MEIILYKQTHQLYLQRKVTHSETMSTSRMSLRSRRSGVQLQLQRVASMKKKSSVGARLELIKYGKMAEVCYDAFDTELFYQQNEFGGCKYSPKHLFAKSSPTKSLGIEGYEATGYLYAETDGPVLKEMDKSVWIGYVAVCTDEEKVMRTGRRDIVVAWRGTQTAQEWLQDLSDLLVPLSLTHHDDDHDDEGVEVEHGFINTYAAVGQDSKCARKCMFKELSALVDKYGGDSSAKLGITVVGHSLGAALATLSGYDISKWLKNINRNMKVRVIVFACPRVGNKAFAKKLEESGIQVVRVVNEKDIVPKVPGMVINENTKPRFVASWLQWLPWAYFHAGRELRLPPTPKPNNSKTAAKVSILAFMLSLCLPSNPITKLAYHHSLSHYLQLLDQAFPSPRLLPLSPFPLKSPRLLPPSPSPSLLKSP